MNITFKIYESSVKLQDSIIHSCVDSDFKFVEQKLTYYYNLIGS